MNIVVFGLSVSSSWGNGHATLWRGLIRALVGRGHAVTFYERDQPYYAAGRDLAGLPGAEIVIYREWGDIRVRARRDIAAADAAIVTSYCADARAADRQIRNASRPHYIYYDLDTPVTLSAIAAGEYPEYLPADGLGHCDLVLSFTGGRALAELGRLLGAHRAQPLYGHVDPAFHRPAAPAAAYTADLSYLGTYAADRQAGLERLLVEPARRRPGCRFLVAGAQYGPELIWPANVRLLPHVPAGEHAAFFASSRLSLNLTRRAMAEYGWCPQGRLFEAAACGAAIVSDVWEGIDSFFTPGEEFLLAQSTEDILAILGLPDSALKRMGAAARARVHAEHTAEARAQTLEAAIESIAGGRVSPRVVPFPEARTA